MGLDAQAERSLIERACSGDGDAQQTLWQMHRRWVAAIVMAHRPRAVDVDDLMQDVAVKFVSKIQTLREPAAFRPWLRRIIINACRGAARGLKPMLHLAETERESDGPRLDLVMPPAAGGGIGPVSERIESASRLLDQVMTLPTEYREPLLLRCVRSMSYQQISEVLDLPITTIETRLARARRMLRDEMGEGTAASG